MPKDLEFTWKDGHRARMVMEDNPVAQFILRCAKHLQHVPLRFDVRENPMADYGEEHAHKLLRRAADRLGIMIQQQRLCDQDYLNQLHQHYVDGYRRSPDPQWLSFHDALHSIEDGMYDNRHNVIVDHKHRAGPLIRPFDRELMCHHVESVQEGDCTVGPHETGKNLWYYYRDREPRDPGHMKSICVPWQSLKPVVSICFRSDSDQQRPYHTDPEFRRWVDQAVPEWSRYWGIEDWHPREIHPRLKVGRVQNWPEMARRMRAGNTPSHLQICG